MKGFIVVSEDRCFLTHRESDREKRGFAEEVIDDEGNLAFDITPAGEAALAEVE